MAPVDERTELLVEHKTDRTIHTHLSDNLPGYPVVGTLASESAACPAPIRYGYRTLDRSWIVPDKRVVNRPNPSLWQIRTAPGQLFLTALAAHAPSTGPATSFPISFPTSTTTAAAAGARIRSGSTARVSARRRPRCARSPLDGLRDGRDRP